MAVNLTPQYHEAEQEYKRAQTPEAKLACLKKMWVLVPKHKASEKLQAELKKKMSSLKDEVEKERASPKKGGPASYKIPRQGAGQFVILGGPNAGKSQLLTKLTNATPTVAPYPFTTREPQPGMMQWEDIRMQLIDMPPITADFLEGYVSSMVRSADRALLMLDLADDDGPFVVETVLEKLAEVKTVLVGSEPELGEDADFSIEYVRTLLLANKSDAEGANDRLDIAREMFGSRFPIQVISAEHSTGLDSLGRAMYDLLEVMRVYTKKPGKPADMQSPYTCPIGSSVLDLAELVHRDIAESLKSARIWGTGVFEGQTVTKDHVLHEKDIVELH